VASISSGTTDRRSKVAQARVTLAKTAVFAASSIPLVWLFWQGLGLGGASLGANPVETVLHSLGTTALNLLLITLAVTPLRRLTGMNWLVRLRRMLGLFCFFYLSLHFLTYALLDLQLAWGELLVDIALRPYITVGMLAWLAMIPLAITSTQKMQRRLGRNWIKLHRLIYPIAILGVVHFFWQAKADLFEPLLYAGMLSALLAFRVYEWIGKTRRRGKPAATAASQIS